MIHFKQILHTYACQQCLTTDMHKSSFDGMEEDLLSISLAGGGQLVRICS